MAATSSRWDLHRIPPEVVDWALGVTLTVVVTVAIAVAPEQQQAAVPWAFALGPILGGLALLRRRWPLAVLFGSAFALFVYNLFDTPGLFAAVPLSVALTNAWAAWHRVWSLVVAAWFSLTPIVFVAVSDLPASLEEDLQRGAVSDVALMAAVLLLGEAVRSRRALAKEQERSESLLLNILPASVADRLRAREEVIADRFPDVTVLFADLVDFTASTAGSDPDEVVRELNELFTVFDGLAQRHGLEKIKTIGDAYMVAGGLPEPRGDHAEAVAGLALELRDEVAGRLNADGRPLEVRIGIDTGPVVAGVIGRHKFSYDLWGDTVNTASRMESQGVPGRIQVTERTYLRLRDRFRLERRGSIQIKGKGEMTTWFLLSRTDPA